MTPRKRYESATAIAAALGVSERTVRRFLAATMIGTHGGTARDQAR